MLQCIDATGGGCSGFQYSSAFDDQVTATSACYTAEADAWTAGAKWILNPNARLILNYIHTNFDAPITLNNKTGDNEDAVVLRTQFDF